MGEAIGQVLSLGVGVALSPIPIIGVVLMLATPRARSNGPAVALKQWRGRPRAGEEDSTPKWMQTIDRFEPPKAAGLGILLSAVNPKNLLLVVGAAAAIAQTGVSAGSQAVALGVFVAVFALSAS